MKSSWRATNRLAREVREASVVPGKVASDDACSRGEETLTLRGLISRVSASSHRLEVSFVKAFRVKSLGSGLRSAVVAAVVLAASGSATAQSAGGGARASATAQVGFERRPQLTPQDELAQADAVVSRMTQAAATVRRQLDTARQARDVVKSLCLSDKLSQIDVATRSARDRQQALQAAAQRNDLELSNHEFTMLTVLRQRTEQLTAEANQCLGEDLSFVGQTQVTTQTPTDLPTEDTTQPSGVPPIVVPPPVAVSGTQ